MTDETTRRPLRVEVDSGSSSPDHEAGLRPVGLGNAVSKTVEIATTELADLIVAMGSQLLDVKTRLGAAAPTSMDATFRIGVGVEGRAFIAKSSATSQLELKLSWTSHT